MYNQEQYPVQHNSEFAPMSGQINNQFDDSNQKLYYQGSQHSQHQDSYMMEGGSDNGSGFPSQMPRTRSGTGRSSKTRTNMRVGGGNPQNPQHHPPFGGGYQEPQPNFTPASRHSQDKGESESSLSNLIRQSRQYDQMYQTSRTSRGQNAGGYNDPNSRGSIGGSQQQQAKMYAAMKPRNLTPRNQITEFAAMRQSRSYK